MVIKRAKIFGRIHGGRVYYLPGIPIYREIECRRASYEFWIAISIPRDQKTKIEDLKVDSVDLNLLPDFIKSLESKGGLNFRPPTAEANTS